MFSIKLSRYYLRADKARFLSRGGRLHHSQPVGLKKRNKSVQKSLGLCLGLGLGLGLGQGQGLGLGGGEEGRMQTCLPTCVHPRTTHLTILELTLR